MNLSVQEAGNEKTRAPFVVILKGKKLKVSMKEFKKFLSNAMLGWITILIKKNSTRALKLEKKIMVESE